MTEPATPDMVAMMDQMGANLRSCADVMGEYRKGLLDADVPDEVADGLVADFARQLHAVMFPAANPLSGLFPQAGGT